MRAMGLVNGRVASVFVAVLALALVGCSSRGAQEPTPTPAATRTASPQTGSPTVAPSATPTDEPAPTETPVPATATATPRPATATAVPSGPSRVIVNGSRQSNLVALTFDMGGRVEPAIQIMEFLIANRIRSTIFMTGAMTDNVNTDAGRRVLQIIDQNRDLFELANHSYTHPDFRDLSAADMASELRRAEESFAKHTSLSARPMWRPPYGGWNNAVLAAVGPAGYPYTIMWDIDTIDWRPEAEGGPTTQFMVNKVVNNAQGGSIVLMHLGGWNTLDALPAMVAGLRAKGFEFAKVSEMLP